MTPHAKLARRIAPAAAVAALAAIWAAPAQAAFPSGNGRVAFASQTFDSSGQFVRSHIETVNPDGSGRAVFTTCRRLRNCRDGDPAWSPSGAFLAFSNLTRLGTAMADGSRVTRLARRTARDVQPAWAPSGQRLAFVGQLQSTSPQEVFILGCPGCAVRRLTFRGGTDPAWSQTDRVAFTRRGNVYTMRSNARRASRLTYRGGSQADWSPFASKLAFVRRGNVYIVGRDGKGLDKITGKGGTQPVWSPDGRQLAFVRSGGIWVVGTDGRGLRQLAAPQAPDPAVPGHTVRLAAPSWQPLR